MSQTGSFKDPATSQSIIGALDRIRLEVAKNTIMRKSLGFLVMLWGLSQFFTSAFVAFDSAARESFRLIEASAVTSQQKMLERK